MILIMRFRPSGLFAGGMRSAACRAAPRV